MCVCVCVCVICLLLLFGVVVVWSVFRFKKNDFCRVLSLLLLLV